MMDQCFAKVRQLTRQFVRRCQHEGAWTCAARSEVLGHLEVVQHRKEVGERLSRTRLRGKEETSVRIGWGYGEEVFERKGLNRSWARDGSEHVAGGLEKAG